MRLSRTLVFAAATVTIVTLGIAAKAAQSFLQHVSDPGIITTRQAISPAGHMMVAPGRVFGVAFAPHGGSLYAVVAGYGGGRIVRFNDAMTSVREDIRLDSEPGIFSGFVQDPSLGGLPPVLGSPGLGGLIIDSRTQRPVVTVKLRDQRTKKTTVQLLTTDGNHVSVVADNLGIDEVGAPALSTGVNNAGVHVAVVPLTFDDQLVAVDAEHGTLLSAVKTGVAPYATAIDARGGIAYVTNWGGRFPEAGDPSAPTGHHTGADRVVVDARGVAASGTVSRVDLASGNVTEIPVGRQPTGLAWDQPRARLYVANSNDDTISVIDTNANTAVGTVTLRPFREVPFGLAPIALAVAPDGERLYVTLAGVNAVAVVRTQDGAVLGLIPTGWYPTTLALSDDGKRLAVGSLLGVGSGGDASSMLSDLNSEYTKYHPKPLSIDQTNLRYVHDDRGTIQLVDVPDNATLARYSEAVATDTHLHFIRDTTLPGRPRTAHATLRALPVPAQPGEPSLIKHVIYIIKENRTYDQLFGDLPHGNNDPSLVMYGRAVTPNHHRLAEQFVTLDATFASGGNSGDGHQWVTQANETPYTYWPGYSGRSYPFEGSDPVAYSRAGFIWTDALRMHRTVADFGEFAGYDTAPMTARIDRLHAWAHGAPPPMYRTVAPIDSLNAVLVHDYPSYSVATPDVVRAQIFLRHLAGWEHRGSMPDLVLVQLPADHTGGLSPGYTTPKATMSDNDYSLGLIVQGLSHSRFWRDMAIFVVEDDAQGSVDHVDGHRMPALAISPYIRRGSIDSTMYSHSSFLKTIELMLGLSPLTVFDSIANDLHRSFTTMPDFRPYMAVRPEQPLDDVNPKLSSLHGSMRAAALASMQMRWDIPDAIDSEVVNRMLWHDAKGWQVAYPGRRSESRFQVAAGADDDDDQQRL